METKKDALIRFRLTKEDAEKVSEITKHYGTDKSKLFRDLINKEYKKIKVSK